MILFGHGLKQKKDATFITSLSEALACQVQRHKKARPDYGRNPLACSCTFENYQFSDKNNAIAALIFNFS